MKGTSKTALLVILTLLIAGGSLLAEKSNAKRVIPPQFIGKWTEVSEGGAISNTITISKETLIWQREGWGKEGRQVIQASECHVEDSGNRILFKSKVVFMKSYFQSVDQSEGQGAVDISLKIDAGNLILTIGEMKERRGPLLITKPAEKHTYFKAQSKK